MGLRVTEAQEDEGLDSSLHGESLTHKAFLSVPVKAVSQDPEPVTDMNPLPTSEPTE